MNPNPLLFRALGQPKVVATSPKKEVHIPFGIKLLTGAVAGMTGTVCIFPLDIVKTRLQNQTIGPNGERMYKGPINCFSSILRTEGFRGLYRGLGANLVGVAPEKAIKLAANDAFREMLTDENGKIALKHEMMAGAGAGFCQVSATNPMEIVKIRMQVQGTLPAAERQGTMEVVKHLGLAGLYRGVGVTWMRDVPFSIVFFPGYANLKKALADPETGECSLLGMLASGAIAGSTAAGSVTPFDVVKTRLQVPGGMARYGGIASCFRTVLAEEGASAFFKGVAPRMIVQAPLFGIAILFYEIQKALVRGTSTE